MYSYGHIPFFNNNMNLLTSLLHNLYVLGKFFVNTCECRPLFVLHDLHIVNITFLPYLSLILIFMF